MCCGVICNVSSFLAKIVAPASPVPLFQLPDRLPVGNDRADVPQRSDGQTDVQMIVSTELRAP